MKGLFILGIFLIINNQKSCERTYVNLNLKLDPSISITKNDKLLFVYGFDDGQAVFCKDLKTGRIKQLTEKNTWLQYPVISPDDKRIAYISYEVDTAKKLSYSRIYMINTDGTNKRVVRDFGLRIAALTWGNDNKRLYFKGALEYDNYSPLAKKDYHNEDIAYTDTFGSKPKLITNLSAYVIGTKMYEVNNMLICHVTKTGYTYPVKIPTDTITTIKVLPAFKLFDDNDIPIFKNHWPTPSNDIYLEAIPHPQSKEMLFTNGAMVFRKIGNKPLELLYKISKEEQEGPGGIRSGVCYFPDGKRILVVKQTGPIVIDTDIFILDAESGRILERVPLDMSSFGSISQISNK